MYLAFEALVSVYGSARQVDAELSHRPVWKLMRRTVKKLFPDDLRMRLPSRPMGRYHYLYGRNRFLAYPEVLAALVVPHRELAAEQARELWFARSLRTGVVGPPLPQPHALRGRKGDYPRSSQEVSGTGVRMPGGNPSAVASIQMLPCTSRAAATGYSEPGSSWLQAGHLKSGGAPSSTSNGFLARARRRPWP